MFQTSWSLRLTAHLAEDQGDTLADFGYVAPATDALESVGRPGTGIARNVKDQDTTKRRPPAVRKMTKR